MAAAAAADPLCSGAVHAPDGGRSAAAPSPAPLAAPRGGIGAEHGLPALLARVKSYDPDADLTGIEQAYALARAAHSAQTRDSGEPYITHPVAVAAILAGYRLDAASLITALLHDVVEDTSVTLAQVSQQFGTEVAGLIDGVTKLTRLELQSDRTKQAENFRKLVLAMSRDIRVLIVKLADRLHNMRTLGNAREDKRRRIARETMDIYAPLAERIGMEKVKTELQTLAFCALEPEAAATIRARLAFLRGQGADVIADVAADLRRQCAEAGVEVIEITGREKSQFSIWEKMQRRNVAFEQLSDIMAFRVVVPTREACYAALGAVHAAHPVIAGRFKDYISTPKSNGYQSLHTGVTLREPRNQKIEVQIRTREMHEVADSGVAAHWVYKHDPKDTKSRAEVQKFRWVQDLLEILENSTADDFLENTKLELYGDQVFCFTPKGQLIQLPRGATPVDFAYAVHSQVGDTCVGAKINGRLMPLRHELQNGDQVEIMTARGGTPSPAWERFVATGKARARIRRFLHAQAREKHLDQGRASLAKAFRQEGVDGSEKVIEPVLGGLKQPTVADLYVAVGNGTIGPREVVNAVYPELKNGPRAPRMMPDLPARTGNRLASRESAMPISGLVAGMAVHYAGCCHPLPGDRIVGIVTTGKGVTIHMKECGTLESFAATPERFIDVDWDVEARADPRARHTGRVSVIATNAPQMLATLTNAVSKQDGAIDAMKIVNRQTDFLEVMIDVSVRDLRHLMHVVASLRAAGGVTQVERARG